MCDLVSVVMSVYNEPVKYVEESVFSMLNQSWKNMEIIIIIDNPENIEARDFLYGIAGKYDKVHVYQNEENKGLPYCLNKGISLAKGKYLARMDADDISLPSRIEEEMAYLNNGNYDIVFSNRIDIDENNNVIREKRIIPQEQKIRKTLPYTCYLTHPTVLMTMSVIKKMNGYREFRAGQDYDLWLRILTNNYKIGVLDKPLLKYRIRMESISRKDNMLQMLMTGYVQQLYWERKRSGKMQDSFSENNIQIFLEKNDYFDIEKKENYKVCYKEMENAIQSMKKKRYVKGIIRLLYSVRNKHVRKIVCDISKVHILR